MPNVRQVSNDRRFYLGPVVPTVSYGIEDWFAELPHLTDRSTGKICSSSATSSVISYLIDSR